MSLRKQIEQVSKRWLIHVMTEFFCKCVDLFSSNNFPSCYILQYGCENASLLAACALLCGAIYPLFSRFNALTAQRQLLGEKLISAELFRSQVQLVLQALIVDPQKSSQVSIL